MTKLHEVVRGVEMKKTYSIYISCRPMNWKENAGYNSLASAEVVVGIPEIANIIHKGIYDKDIDEEHPVRNLHIYAIAKIIATAIESGAVLSLKKED